jgi:hypothetical protein
VYDTVRFSKDVGLLDPAELAKRGDWRWQSNKSLATGEVHDKFYLNAESDEVLPRLTWYGGSGVMTAEVSLPKLLNGENVSLIHEADLPAAFQKVSEFVSDATGKAAEVGAWNLSRADYCFSWSVGDLLPLYLEAVGKLHLSKHNRQSVDTSSVTWHSKANKLYFYDKHRESGLDIAEGVLRLEATVRNTHYLAEKWLKTERTAAALLTDANAVKMLSYFLKRLGLSQEKPIFSKVGLMAKMVSEFGVVGFEKMFGFLALYAVYGSKLASADGHYSKRTYYRRRKQLAEAGLLAWHSEPDVVLPALAVRGQRQTSLA